MGSELFTYFDPKTHICLKIVAQVLGSNLHLLFYHRLLNCQMKLIV